MHQFRGLVRPQLRPSFQKYRFSRRFRPDWRDSQSRRFALYRESELTNVEAHDLTIAALDGRVIAASKIPAVLDEWRNPRHEEFEPRTAWSWFNAVTEVLKDYGAVNNLPRTQALHGVLDQHCGIAIAS